MLLTEYLYDSNKINEFHKSCEMLGSYCERSYNYTGANFDNHEVLSIKLYRTFFCYDELFSVFPYPEIEERVLLYRDVVSRHHITTPFVPGCGFTYTLKLDSNGSVSRGVYFRVRCDSARYIKLFLSRMGIPESYCKFFDGSGVLKYISVDGGGIIRERNYIYCIKPSVMEKFDGESGILLSQADCLEVSTGWDEEVDSNRMSIIGLSRNALASDSVKLRGAKVERALRRHGIISESNFALYGYYLQKKVHSIFFFDDKGVRLPKFTGEGLI